MEKNPVNIADLDERKIITFASNYVEVMKNHIGDMINKNTPNYDLFIKQLDGLLYAYTGNEDIIVDKSEKKIASVKKHLHKLYEDFSTKSPMELAKDMVETFDISKKQKQILLSDIDDSDECRGTLIANIMTHKALMMCVKINPNYFLKNRKEDNDDSDSNESGSGASDPK